MIRFYLAPKVGTGTITDPRRAKYFSEQGIFSSGMDLGIESLFLVGADTDDAQHSFLSAQGDITVIPPLDQVVGGNPTLNVVRNKLEQAGIPGTWIQATTTYHQIVSTSGDTCMIAQRLNGLHKKRLYPPGVTLDSTLSPEMLAEFQSIADSFGIDDSMLSTSTTVRQALLALGNQLPPFTLAGVQF